MNQLGRIAAIGTSLSRLLSSSFAEAEPALGLRARAILVRTEDLRSDQVSNVLIPPMISVFLYRIDFNKTMRAAWSGVGYQQDKAILPLDLHYLLTPWAANAEYEHRLIELALQTLETTPMLTGPLLDPSVGWAPGEAIQVVLEEIATPDLLRIFDALPIDYKLSVPYVARVLSIESPVLKQTPPVTAVLRRDGRP